MKPSSRPRNAHVCPYCNAMVVLHARLPGGVVIPCRSCGRSFQARQVPRAGADPGRTGTRLVAACRREIRWMMAGAVLGLAAAGGLMGPAVVKSLRATEHQWEIETERQGRQAVFSLYGTAPDEIEYVRASTREGALSSDGGWTRWKGPAERVGEGRLLVRGEGETWEICLGPAGRSRASVTRGSKQSIYEGVARRVP